MREDSITKRPSSASSPSAPKTLHPSMWGSLTTYYGLFLFIVGLFWGLGTTGIAVPFWPNSYHITNGTPLIGGSYLNLPALVFFLMGAITLIGTWRAPRKISYIIDDQVVRIREGRPWGTKLETELLKRNISEVEVKQTFLQKILPLPMGTVIVRSLLDPEGELVMQKVRRPNKVRDTISSKPT